MDLLFGTPLKPFLRRIAAAISGPQTEIAKSRDAVAALRQLPWMDATEDRLQMALGAALALKTQKQGDIVMAYAYHSQLPKRAWNKILALAAQLNLPIIFVLLPEADGKGDVTNICAQARAAGVPGIPVDATDAVALYRVSQESMGRSRGGDGPVLIECIFSGTGGQRAPENSDPILHLKRFLTGRKVCTEAWANHVSDAFRKRLAAASR
jgi:TPP-dependent pyruvate/acetoin dehydrogenase alpha subunit